MTRTEAETGAILEVCVESPAGAVAAAVGGADRIELCAALTVGGLTPSVGLVELTLAATGLPIHAMVRPRPGDFEYDADDLALALAEGRALIAQGVAGLVFGVVEGGRVNADAARRWLEAIRDAAGHAIPCTFHRAIDLVDDPVAAVETIADLGFDRILTSGGAVRAIDGVATIRAMVARTGGRVAIAAGSGVSAQTIAPLIAGSGTRHFHASASRPVGSIARGLVDMGFSVGPQRTTDAALVHGLRSALDNAFAIGH